MVKHRATIAQAPTGGGKSKVFIEIARMAAGNGTTTLILTEAVKIFSQIAKEYPAHNIDAGTKLTYIRPGATFIAMAQTLSRRPQLIEQFKRLGNRLLIINDEAHIGTATNLLKQFDQAYLLGFTATPAWKWARHLSDLYYDLVPGPQVAELISAGYLTPYQHFARVAADTDVLKIQNGEFTEESQQVAFESAAVYDALAGDLKTITHRKAIIFTSCIQHCERLTAALALRGINAVQIHSKRSEAENSYAKKHFEDMASGWDACVSVGTMTKGYDFPPIDLVVLMRATTSLPLYLQMIGRGSRPLLDHTGQHLLNPIGERAKPRFTCLDYGNNYTRHSLWHDDRDWSQLWLPQKGRQSEGVAPIKCCPKCDYINPSVAQVCANCGHVFEKRAPVEVETKLIDITANWTGRKISSLEPTELADFARARNKKQYAIRVAKAREQTNPGFLQDFATAMGYNPGWTKHQNIPNDPIPFHDILIR